MKRKGAVLSDSFVLLILALFMLGLILFFAFPYLKKFYFYLTGTAVFGAIFDALG